MSTPQINDALQSTLCSTPEHVMAHSSAPLTETETLRGNFCATQNCTQANSTNDPTPAPPGSSAKLEILRRRAEQGLPLFHPLDNNALAGLARACPWYHGTDHQEARQMALEALAQRRAELCG